MLIWPIDDIGDVRDWSVEIMLEEINRDRNSEWIPYDETDYLTGWDDWVEGDFYTRHDPTR